MSFCAENVCLVVFFKLRVIFGRLVHVHLKNYGLALLISSTDTEKMQVTASGAYHWNGKSGDTPHYAVNFATEKHFIMLIQIVLPALEFDKFFQPSNLVIVVKIYA